MATLLLVVLAAPQAALAHPLDEYLQATYLTVTPTRIEVELNLTPGVLLAPQVLPELDPNGDEQISETEGEAYVDAVLRDVVLEVDGQPLALAVTRIDMPAYLNFQAGYGTIRVFTTATLPDGLTGTHRISYTNNYTPSGSTYQVNAFVDQAAPVTLGGQNRDSSQQRLTMDIAIGGELDTSAMADPAVETPAGVAQAQRLLAYLDAPSLSPFALLLALGLAGLLGGLHALTPGHGKTLVAAYLVGSRGTVRDAVALGGIVTFTHTASVILIGVLALIASQFIVPDVLVPVLEVLAGVLVVAVGVRLVWQRWTAFRHRDAGSTHAHDHGHSHDHHAHDHDPEHGHGHSHDHGDGHTHSHVPPVGRLKLGSLVAMGVSGGLVPCPEALGIMIIAIGLNRILLGLGLIVSFSFGLAAVLIVLGILLVRSRSLVERLGSWGERGQRFLPLGSAVIVTVLGAAMCVKGVLAYFG